MIRVAVPNALQRSITGVSGAADFVRFRADPLFLLEDDVVRVGATRRGDGRDRPSLAGGS